MKSAADCAAASPHTPNKSDMTTTDGIRHIPWRERLRIAALVPRPMA